MKELSKVQEEINLLVKQAILVTELEIKHLEFIKKMDYQTASEVRVKLDSIYPTYLELREKYLKD